MMEYFSKGLEKLKIKLFGDTQNHNIDIKVLIALNYSNTNFLLSK
jgi:hypothetical protein